MQILIYRAASGNAKGTGNREQGTGKAARVTFQPKHRIRSRDKMRHGIPESAVAVALSLARFLSAAMAFSKSPGNRWLRVRSRYNSRKPRIPVPADIPVSCPLSKPEYVFPPNNAQKDPSRNEGSFHRMTFLSTTEYSRAAVWR